MNASPAAASRQGDAHPHIEPYDEAKRRYDRDGFVIVRGFATPAEVEDIRDRAEPIARRLLAADPDRARFKQTVKNLDAESPWFADLLAAGRHVPLMRTLIGDELEPATAAWFDRPCGSDQIIDPHIDGGGRGRGSDVGATIWFPLDPAGPENGCLYYRRGSHLAEHTKNVFVDGFDKATDAVAAEVEPGDAVVHNALTVHWSGANLSNRPRRAVSMFYWGVKSHAAWLKRMGGKPPWLAQMKKPGPATR